MELFAAGALLWGYARNNISAKIIAVFPTRLQWP